MKFVAKVVVKKIFLYTVFYSAMPLKHCKKNSTKKQKSLKHCFYSAKAPNVERKII